MTPKPENTELTKLNQWLEEANEILENKKVVNSEDYQRMGKIVRQIQQIEKENGKDNTK